jgi:hypothetical protein
VSEEKKAYEVSGVVVLIGIFILLTTFAPFGEGALELLAAESQLNVKALTFVTTTSPAQPYLD